MSTEKEMSYFGSIKNIDDTTRSIVVGFVRSVETLFVKRIHIPSEIALMCLLYYYNPEYFTMHGSNMILKDNKQTVESNFHNIFDETTAYGNVEINKNDYIKCVWNFEIKKCNKTYTVVIGIACASNKEFQSTEQLFVTEWLTEEDEDENHTLCGYNYGYQNEDTFHELLQTKVILRNKTGSCILNYDKSRNYGCIWNVGDIVTMELDVENETLKYYVNSIDQGIAVECVHFDDNVKYVMAVAFDGETIIKLIDFKATYKI